MSLVKYAFYDSSKFTVVGSPTITADGIASGFSTSNYLRKDITLGTSYIISGEANIDGGNEDNCFISIVNSNNKEIAVEYNINTKRMDIYNNINWGSLNIQFSENLSHISYQIIFENNTFKFVYKANYETISHTITTTETNFATVLASISYIALGNSGKQWTSNWALGGTIDLKQFSITVDGEEVFSGARHVYSTSQIYDYEHLPKIVTDTDGIEDVLLAIDPEIALVKTDLSDLKDELYAKTTNKYITRWEDDFSLSHDVSLSLDERRQRIINKMARKKTLTWEELDKLIENNVECTQFYVINKSSSYSFQIVLIEAGDTTQLSNAVNKAKPAYITFEIVPTHYFRKCGTFNCGTSPL